MKHLAIWAALLTGPTLLWLIFSDYGRQFWSGSPKESVPAGPEIVDMTPARQPGFRPGIIINGKVVRKPSGPSLKVP